MAKRYETRHVFLAIGICMIISSLILLLFVPQSVADIVHRKSGVWQVFVSKEHFIMYGVGLFLICLAPMLLAFMDIKLKSIMLSIACILLSLIPMYIASQAYQTISNEGISNRPIFAKNEVSYPWDQVERVIFYENKEGGFSDYVIHFNDGKMLTFKGNGYFQRIVPLLINKLREINVELERV